jgi:hypothetical protein
MPVSRTASAGPRTELRQLLRIALDSFRQSGFVEAILYNRCVYEWNGRILRKPGEPTGEDWAMAVQASG